MKYECEFCNKIIRDPLVQDCGKQGIFYFCDVKCRDDYVKNLQEFGRCSDPISLFLFICGELLKTFFSRFKKQKGGKKVKKFKQNEKKRNIKQN